MCIIKQLPKSIYRRAMHSEYGLAVGKDMKEGKPNGSVRKPYFNLVVKDEDE